MTGNVDVEARDDRQFQERAAATENALSSTVGREGGERSAMTTQKVHHSLITDLSEVQAYSLLPHCDKIPK